MIPSKVVRDVYASKIHYNIFLIKASNWALRSRGVYGAYVNYAHTYTYEYKYTYWLCMLK